MSVTSKFSWRYNGINTAGLNDTTGHSPEGLGRPCQGTDEQSESGDVLGKHVGFGTKEGGKLADIERLGKQK